MILNLLLLFSMLPAFTSCQTKRGEGVAKMNTAIGDTVSAPDNNIWVIFQDRDGRYWFGSNGKGAYRYDGVTILRFSTSDGLANDTIRTIQEDKAGNIFFGTMAGISKFDGEKFSTLPEVESNEWRLDTNDLWFSILGKTGDDGPYRYDGKTLHRLKFPKHDLEDSYYAEKGRYPWSPYEVYTIYQDSKGNIWFGTAGLGVCRYDGRAFDWLYEKTMTEIPGGGSFGIRSVFEDSAGKFWFCNTGFRYHIYADVIEKGMVNYKSEKGIDLLKNQNGGRPIYFHDIVEDHQRNIWMSTYSEGIWKYNGVKMAYYPVMDGHENALIICLYKDRRGDLWLGTQQAGVYKYNGKAFGKFKP